MTPIPELKGPSLPLDSNGKAPEKIDATDLKVQQAASFSTSHESSKAFKASKSSFFKWLTSFFSKLFGKNEEIKPLKPSEMAIPYPDSSGQALEYYQLTKRVSKTEMAAIEAKMKGLESKEDLIKVEFQAFENGMMEFDDWDKAAIRALYALKMGFISKETFATFLNFRVAHQQYKEIEKIPLFLADGSRNPRVLAYLQKTGNFFPSLGEDFQTNFLNDSQIDQFFEIMKSKPKSAQVFFIGNLEDPHPGSITQEIRRETGLEIFNVMDQKRVIPSFEILQALLDAAFHENAVKMNPVIGLSSYADIEANAMFNSRDVALYFPGVALPDSADDFPVEGIDFTYHDFYHAFIASNVPKNIQPLFNLCYSILGPLSSKYPEKKEIIEKLRLKLLDMEHAEFRMDNRNNRSDSQLFWDVLEYRWKKLDPKGEHSEIIRYLLVQLKKLSRSVDWEKETGVSGKAENELSSLQFWAGLEERFNHYLGFLFPRS